MVLKLWELKRKNYTQWNYQTEIEKGINRIYLGKSSPNSYVYINKGNFNPEKNKNLWLTEEEIKKDFEWAWQFAKEIE